MRITGLETEYGCLVEESIPVREVVARIRDWFFENDRYGLIDVHDRDWDEPAGNGGFLFNGGRIYVDMGHLEYCTPECVSAVDVVRYDRAGDRLLLEAIGALGLGDVVGLIRNNVDHYTGATFGCHENYSMSRRAKLTERNIGSLLAFLTLRILFTGAGRVGIARSPHEPRRMTKSEGRLRFQISQRADHVQNDFFEWVQHNRAIINTRDEPLADPQHYRRLHLIHGDTNVLPAALFLKVGATRLALDLLEAGELPPIRLADAVATLRALSRRTSPPWLVSLADGRTGDAVALLGQYQERAEKLLRGRDSETDAVLRLWSRVLEGLASGPESLVGILDWVSKEHLLREFCRREGLEWGHAWLESQDLEFHHLDPERGLGLAMAETDGLWNPTGWEECLGNPPANSRACARSGLMRQIRGMEKSYILNWETVEIPGRKLTRLADPFQP